MKGEAKRLLSNSGGWVAHRLELKESPAWAALSDNGRRALDRLELEHMRQGGRKNGALVCTYTDFVKAGVRRQSVREALLQAQALGFIQIMRAGYKTAAEFRVPSLYRLTYVFGRPPCDWRTPTDEWEACATADEAARILSLVAAELAGERAGRSRAAGCESVTDLGAKTSLRKAVA